MDPRKAVIHIPPVAPPHTRGWTLGRLGARQDGLGSPAHAGMDPHGRRTGAATIGLPRTRGDGPVSVLEIEWDRQAPPHTRGWTRRRSDPLEARGSPAHAGMDPGARGFAPSRPGLPRTRGDGPVSASTLDETKGAPPHTRGMDRGTAPGRPAPDRLPRTRGDGPEPIPVRRQDFEAPPHTRGWTRVRLCGRLRGRGSPAHAGMDPAASARKSAGIRLPRTRGDGPVTSPHVMVRSSAPPHTRGWTLAGVLGVGGHGGSPAHAGMDRSDGGRIRRPGRLPRTRGDGPLRIQPCKRRNRAPPHTRGWTQWR